MSIEDQNDSLEIKHKTYQSGQNKKSEKCNNFRVQLTDRINREQSELNLEHSRKEYIYIIESCIDLFLARKMLPKSLKSLDENEKRMTRSRGRNCHTKSSSNNYIENDNDNLTTASTKRNLKLKPIGFENHYFKLDIQRIARNRTPSPNIKLTNILLDNSIDENDIYH